MASQQTKAPHSKGRRTSPAAKRQRPGKRTARSVKTAWVAHHEAAHAVAKVRQDVLCDATSIIPHGSTLGQSTGVDPLDIAPGEYDEDGAQVPNAEGVEKGIISLFAGYFGGMQAGQPKIQAEGMADSDFLSAERLLQYTTSHRNDLLRRAEALVEKNRAAIHAVAVELTKWKTLSGEDIDLIIAESDGDPRARTILEQLRRERLHVPGSPPK